VIALAAALLRSRRIHCAGFSGLPECDIFRRKSDCLCSGQKELDVFSPQFRVLLDFKRSRGSHLCNQRIT
jgi:hypothetical protein